MTQKHVNIESVPNLAKLYEYILAHGVTIQNSLGFQSIDARVWILNVHVVYGAIFKMKSIFVRF